MEHLAALAEQYFRDDPGTAIFKLRQFAELLAKLIAAHHAVYESQTFEEALRRLSYDRILPKEAADLFHAIRKSGNAAVHEFSGTHAEALTSLKLARSLAVWYHRAYGRQPGFNPRMAQSLQLVHHTEVAIEADSALCKMRSIAPINSCMFFMFRFTSR